MAVPRSMLASTAPGKLPVDEAKRYARGVIAHLAIQTAYRLQHPGNFVVSERSIWVGDTSSSTISRFADLLDRGKDILDKGTTAADVLAKGMGAGAADVTSFLLYVLNDSTLDVTSRVVYKRYDIVDFGPLAALNRTFAPSALAIDMLGGQAYEIKSDDPDQQKQGAAYLSRQTGRFNTSIGKYGGAVASALKIPGLEKFALQPGASWPPAPQMLWLGQSILEYQLAGPAYPGVISYRWKKFDPRSLKRMWQLYRRVVRDVQKQLRAQGSSLRPATVAAAVTAAVLAVAFVGIVIGGIAEAAATEIVLEELGAAGGALAPRALAPRATMLAFGRAAGAATPLVAAPPAAGETADPSAPAGGDEAPDAGQGAGTAQTAFDYATGQNATDRLLFPEGPAEQLAGGTGATADESFVAGVVDSIVNEILFRYAAQVGQGDEDRFNAETIGVLRDNLNLVMSGFAGQIGAAGLRELFGVEESAADGPKQVGIAIAQFAATIMESSGGARFFEYLFDLPDDEIPRMFPADFGEDGERPS